MNRLIIFGLNLKLRIAYLAVIYFVFVKLMGIPLETVLLVEVVANAIGFSWKNAMEETK